MSNAKVVLVTGASRGIGKAIALEFAKNHFKVGINFVKSDAKAEATAAEIKKLGGEALLLKADVADSTQTKKMVDQICDHWGCVDVLINNAGITRDRTILKMTDAEWEDVIRTDLSGPFWCLRACAKKMSEQKSGSIINISSIIGVRASIGNANYAAAKAGLIGLTKAAGKELGRFNIKVNCVLPGFHKTDMGEEVWDKLSEQVRQEHVLGRFTDLSELSRFIFFLATQESASGQVYNFDSRVLG